MRARTFGSACSYNLLNLLKGYPWSSQVCAGRHDSAYIVHALHIVSATQWKH